jgi:hypothetical protein
MAKKMMVISDLTGEPIKNDNDAVTIVLWDHPLLEEPVQLDANKSEVAKLKGTGKDYAVVELLSDGGDTTERMVLELAEFEKLFKVEVDEALQSAEKYRYGPPKPTVEEPKRRGRPAGAKSAIKGDKVNYRSVEFAGRPHRGRLTDEEKTIVQENFDAVNANLKAAGIREIDLAKSEDVEKYNLYKLAQTRGVVPK